MLPGVGVSQQHYIGLSLDMKYRQSLAIGRILETSDRPRAEARDLAAGGAVERHQPQILPAALPNWIHHRFGIGREARVATDL